jgi:hypothetical protein
MNDPNTRSADHARTTVQSRIRSPIAGVALKMLPDPRSSRCNERLG